MNKFIILVLLLLFELSLHSQEKDSQPVEIKWEMGKNRIRPFVYDNTFTITNLSNKPLDNNWAIYYNQMSREIIPNEDSGIEIEEVKPNFFKMSPTDKYKPLPPKSASTISFLCKGGLIKESHAPESFYFVRLVDGKETKPMEVKVTIEPFDNKDQWNRQNVGELPYPDGVVVYNDNLRFKDNISLKQTDIFPSLKSVTELTGKIKLEKEISIHSIEEFAFETDYLIHKLQSLYGIGIVSKKNPNIILSRLDKNTSPKNEEYYEITIENHCIRIAANTSHGAFNGVQSLLGMMKNQQMPISLSNVKIHDYPDLMYRGLMLDVARNFTTKQNLLKLIDRLATYKINILHLHLSDDEGWRIEIPGIEELTSVGASRAHTLDEQESLYPNYSGGAFCSESGTGFYTSADFAEILKYAHERHISVIPEIDLPGHARAAIVAIKARYNKYIDTDRQKAEEYLLSDLNDKSTYVSAQGYTDNVINVALPSTYSFVQKVIDEIVAIYAQTDVPMLSFHMGGDEVPRGSWEKSDICQQFMKDNNFLTVAELRNYFIDRTATYIQSKGVDVAAWQEAALSRDEKVNPQHLGKVNSLYAWNTMPEWDADHIPYSLANAGYGVILCNLTNFYFDLAYNKHQSEPGHIWAGFVNEYNSFDMLPYHVYQSTRHNLSGKPFNLNTIANKKQALSQQGAKHIKGVQGQLFTETIRSYGMVEYYLFPKMLGLVERGWNAFPEWSDTTDWNNNSDYSRALAVYHAKIAKGELPRLAQEGCNFRLSQPGMIVKDGKLFANAALPDAEIRYTTDGSEPTSKSPLWNAPVSCNAKLIKAKCFLLDKESVTTRLMLE